MNAELKPCDLEALKQLTDETGSKVDKSEDNHDWDLNTLPPFYDVEKLDYSYLRSAENIRELKQLLAVLRSGKEGRYEALELAFECKIQDLGGKLYKKEPRSFIGNSENSEIDSKILADLKSWASSGDLDSKPKLLEKKLELENQKGNEFMNAGDYEEAFVIYSKCVRVAVNEFQINPKFAANCSMACLKLKQYQKTIEYATLALEQCASGILKYKCLIRRARALMMEQRFAESLADYRDCESIEGIQNPCHRQYANETELRWRTLNQEAYAKYTMRDSESSCSPTITIAVVDDSDTDDDEVQECTRNERNQQRNVKKSRCSSSPADECNEYWQPYYNDNQHEQNTDQVEKSFADDKELCIKSLMMGNGNKKNNNPLLF